MLRFERFATAIRHIAGLTNDEELLDPFDLAHRLGLLVVFHDEVPDLDPSDARLLGDVYSSDWSGATIFMERNGRVVVLNRSHLEERQRATLMEEICHTLMGHPLTSLTEFTASGTAVRDYTSEDEKEAYWTGAAALLPYLALRRRIGAGVSAADVAAHFKVSEDLVKFRIKVTGLWSRFINQSTNQ